MQTSHLPAILILAAGSSSRLGEPKQLLSFNGRSLLRQMAETALSVNGSSVLVVLGKNADTLEQELTDLPVHTVINDDWESGMASSINVGISELQKRAPHAASVIIMVCDQPFVSAQILEQLIKRGEETEKEIVACAYADTVGVPALFRKAMFPHLLSLKGNEGAKKIMLHHKDLLATIPFEKGKIDIDTKEDWDKFVARLD